MPNAVSWLRVGKLHIRQLSRIDNFRTIIKSNNSEQLSRDEKEEQMLFHFQAYYHGGYSKCNIPSNQLNWWLIFPGCWQDQLAGHIQSLDQICQTRVSKLLLRISIRTGWTCCQTRNMVSIGGTTGFVRRANFTSYTFRDISGSEKFSHFGGNK